VAYGRRSAGVVHTGPKLTLGTTRPTSLPWLMRSKPAAVALFFGVIGIFGALSAPTPSLAASLTKAP
jgi:hypothetical protein